MPNECEELKSLLVVNTILPRLFFTVLIPGLSKDIPT